MTGTALAFLLAGVLALRLAWMLLSEAGRRREARAMATICLIDGLTHLIFAIHAQLDQTVSGPPGPQVARGSAMLLGLALVDLADAFPGAPPAAWRRRAALGLTACGVGLAGLTGRPVWIELAAFICSVGSLSLLIARRGALRGTRYAAPLGLLIAVMLLRFVLGGAMLGRGVLEPFFPGVTDALVAVRRGAVPLLGDVLISLAILRARLLDPARLTSRLLLSAGAVLATLLLAALAVDAALRAELSPGLARVLLLGATCIPAGALAAWWTWGPRVEAALLDRARAATRREALEEVARAAAELSEPREVIDCAARAAARVAGGEPRFLPGAPYAEGDQTPLPGALAALFAAPGRATLAPDELPAGLGLGEVLPAGSWELLVPVRRGHTLHGALVLATPLAHEELRTVSAIADQLAVRLDHELVFRERMRAQQELASSRHLAALGTFAAAVAHDIRTPLTSIKMNVQLLQAKVSLDPDDMEHFEIALEELGRLDATAGAILTFAKPAPLCAVALDLDEVISGAIRALAPQLEARRLRVVREESGGPLSLLGDVQALRRVLQNLLSNAAEASPSGAVIGVHTRREDGWLVLEVRDAGRGIRTEDLPRIFEPFFTKRSGGTGLGLAIVERLVRAHGGEVRAASPPGGGAVFAVRLPASRPEEGPPTPA